VLNNANTLSRTPLEKGSAHHEGLWLTTSNTDKTHTPVTSVGFKPTIPASQWLQIYTHTQSLCQNFNRIHCCLLEVQSEQGKIVSGTSDCQSWHILKKNQEKTLSELYVPCSYEKYVEAGKLLSIWEELIRNILTDTCSGDSRFDSEEETNTFLFHSFKCTMCKYLAMVTGWSIPYIFRPKLEKMMLKVSLKAA
jgi:hypothetical protein